jgi:hypothetical protein
MSLLLHEVQLVAQEEFQLDPPVFRKSAVTADDRRFITRECATVSPFDPENRRQRMLRHVTEGGGVCEKWTCRYGSVILLLESEEQRAEIPLELWARILRLYAIPGTALFRVFLFGLRHLRQFPSRHEAIKAIHINGGYTYPCRHDTIVIHRLEDATRVLLHELQHSTCLDHEEDGTDLVEAETEAWAELWHVALLSQGKPHLFHRLLQLQSDWIQDQNERVRDHMKDPQSMEFPWRYTIGKENVWRRWGILRPFRGTVRVGQSLRLTCVPSDALQRTFGVLGSTAL